MAREGKLAGSITLLFTSHEPMNKWARFLCPSEFDNPRMEPAAHIKMVMPDEFVPPFPPLEQLAREAE